MKRKLVISYEWWDANEPSNDIPEEFVNWLETRAEEEIKIKSNEGFTSGLLFVAYGDEYDEDIYRGTWEFERLYEEDNFDYNKKPTEVKPPPTSTNLETHEKLRVNKKKIYIVACDSARFKGVKGEFGRIAMPVYERYIEEQRAYLQRYYYCEKPITVTELIRKGK